jgi:hypothetical protein
VVIRLRESIEETHLAKEVKTINETGVLVGTSVRLNRLASGGYSWTVTVASAGDSLADLRHAKDAALALSQELQDELLTQNPEDEIPF